MSDEIKSVSEEVARQVYPAAVSQARAQVIIQLAVIAAFVLFWSMLGFPRRLAWTVGMITTGAVASAYDIRWWLWVRRANPIDAYVRMQARDDREGGSRRFRLTLLAGLLLLALWWFVRK